MKSKIAFLFGLCLWCSFVMADPPVEPMILSGEVVKNNTTVDKDSELIIEIDGTEYTTKTTVNYSNRSVYYFSISEDIKKGAEVHFKSLDGVSLAQIISPIPFEKGALKIQNIIIDSSLPVALQMSEVSVVKSNDEWTVKAIIKEDSKEYAGGVRYGIRCFAYGEDAYDGSEGDTDKKNYTEVDKELYPTVAYLGGDIIEKDAIQEVYHFEMKTKKDLQNTRFIKVSIYSIKDDDTESVITSFIVIPVEEGGEV